MLICFSFLLLSLKFIRGTDEGKRVLGEGGNFLSTIGHFQDLEKTTREHWTKEKLHYDVQFLSVGVFVRLSQLARAWRKKSV